MDCTFLVSSAMEFQSCVPLIANDFLYTSVFTDSTSSSEQAAHILGP